MGADNGAHDGDMLMRRSVPKLWNVSEMIAVGVSGEARLNNVLRGAPWPWVSDLEPGSVSDALTNSLTPFLQSKFPDKNRKICALIAVGRYLYHLSPDLCIIPLENSYWALGNAEQVALGALFAEPYLAPRDRVHLALRAAKQHVSGIQPPWTFVETKAYDNELTGEFYDAESSSYGAGTTTCR